MAFIIASVPFWILGTIGLLSAATAAPARRPDETDADIVKQVLSSLLFAGVFYIIAALIATWS